VEIVSWTLAHRCGMFTPEALRKLCDDPTRKQFIKIIDSLLRLADDAAGDRSNRLSGRRERTNHDVIAIRVPQ
jgi:hypothetical protein